MRPITLNGRLFVGVRSANQAAAHSRDPVTSGVYTVRRGAVHIFDLKGEPDAVINALGVFGCATKQDDGRVWYSYATPKLIGEFPSYGDGLRQVEAARAIAISS